MKKYRFLFPFLVFFMSSAEAWANGGEGISVPVSSTPVSTTIRSVSAIAQKASKLCWATCMQMITSYHSYTTLTQGDFRIFLWKIDRDDTPSTAFTAACASLSCTSGEFVTLSTSTSAVDYAIPHYYGRNRQSFDAVFSKAGFYSNEDTARLNWDRVKSQINKCRPFIMILREAEATDNTHAVVVKGYKEVGDEKQVIVNDPWGINKCESITYYLRYPDSATITMMPIESHSDDLITVQSFVHDIHPKKYDVCRPCTKYQRKKVIDGDLPRPDELHNLSRSIKTSEMRSTKPNFYVKVHYISSSKLKNPKVTLQIDSVKTKHKVVDLINTSKVRYIAYTLEGNQANTAFRTVKIAYSDYQPEVILNNKPIKLSFRTDRPGVVQYEHVRIPALFQRYYRFLYNDAWFLVPAIEYQFPDGIPLSPAVAYPEHEVLDKIRRALNK